MSNETATSFENIQGLCMRCGGRVEIAARGRRGKAAGTRSRPVTPVGRPRRQPRLMFLWGFIGSFVAFAVAWELTFRIAAGFRHVEALFWGIYLANALFGITGIITAARLSSNTACETSMIGAVRMRFMFGWLCFTGLLFLISVSAWALSTSYLGRFTMAG